MSSNQSFTTSLLLTHARFADVYGLFESVVKELPEALAKEFITEVDQIRGKLDSWKALFTYEKEKTKFLTKKGRRKSYSDVLSIHSPESLPSPDGSCDCSGDSACATPTSSAIQSPKRSEPSPQPPPSVVSTTTQDDGPAPENDIVPSVLDCLPLVLDNENDETWLSAVPQAPLEAVQEEDVKLELKPAASPRKTASVKKPITEKVKTSTDWLRAKIPKVPGRSKLRNNRLVGSPGASSLSPAKTKPSRSGRYSVELSTQSETRNHRFHSTGGRPRSRTV